MKKIINAAHNFAIRYSKRKPFTKWRVPMTYKTKNSCKTNYEVYDVRMKKMKQKYL